MFLCCSLRPPLAAPNITEPSVDCSALELIAPDIWVTMDGYVLFVRERFLLTEAHMKV